MLTYLNLKGMILSLDLRTHLCTFALNACLITKNEIRNTPNNSIFIINVISFLKGNNRKR